LVKKIPPNDISNPLENIEKKYGLVIFLDVLGTKGMWKERDPTEIITDYRYLTSFVKKQ
jgi:hypothetical protein